MNNIYRHITFLLFVVHLFISSMPIGSLGTNQSLEDALTQPPDNSLAIMPIPEESFILSSSAVSKLKNIHSSPARFIPQASRLTFPGLESERTYPLHNIFFNFPFICYKFSLSAYTAAG